MDAIKAGIRNIYPVSNSALDALSCQMKPYHLPRKHLLIRSGVVDKHYYFIEKGLTRSYCLVKGNEATSWFSKEGELTFSMLSCYENKPGYECVDLLEPSVIYAVPVKVLNALYEEHIDLANWSRLLHQKAFLDLEQRHIALATQSARERYENFIRERPGLMQRVKLGYIASFLGITQVTLSRLRAERSFLT